MKSNYSIFFDFHTSTIIPDVGKNFDVEKFTDDLQSCGVDFLTWHARCNQGNAYYDTEFGYKHPSLEFDLLGKLTEACHRKGIRISAYFNGALSDEELLHNPQWMRIAPDGHSMTEQRPSAEIRAVCYNSSFRDHLIAMVREVIQKYGVDGIFIDCLGSYYTCICPTCIAEMKKLGINFRDEAELKKFTVRSIKRLVKDLVDAAREINPNAFFFYNGTWQEDLLQLCSHLECECLPPCMDLGYDYLPVHAHYLRTVVGDNSALCMTGRFYQWGDFGGLRKEESIEYDLLYGMANGMRPEVSDHFHPRGDSYEEVFDLVRNTYATVRKYDPWCLDAVNRPNIAVVYHGNTRIRDISDQIKSAVRMLTELKVQFNVVTEASSWDSYDLLIFPDDVQFSEETARRVQAHLDRGGKVIASGESGLDMGRKGFVIDAWPVKYLGPTPYDPLYYLPEGDLATGLPKMPLSVYASGVNVAPADGAEVKFWTVKPYHNHEWDGLHSNWYTPPQGKCDLPFLAVKGNIAYFSANIFTGYFNRAPFQTRMMLDNVLRMFVPQRKFTSTTLPSYARAFVQYKDNLELLHVMCYTPELRGNSVALEERGVLVNSELSLRIDDQPFKKVYLAPSGQELPFTVKDGYCTVTLPLLEGYALLVFEK